MSDRAVVDVDDLGDLAVRFPLDDLADARNKHDRGTVLLIGGSAETPGSMVLAADAALAAGAGRVQIATTATTAAGLGVAVPEARVIGLRAEGPHIAADALDDLGPLLAAADVVLVGTGALDVDRTAELARAALALLGADQRIVLDAAGLAVGSRVPDAIREHAEQVLAIPNVVEAGHLLDQPASWVEEHLVDAIAALLDQLDCPVALRGSATICGAPGGPLVLDTGGTPLLATAGSGDVLAGVVAGLATRTDDLVAAAVRAVRTHGLAGRAAADSTGGAFLARRLLDGVPACVGPA